MILFRVEEADNNNNNNKNKNKIIIDLF